MARGSARGRAAVWLYEDGIGEARAALVADGAIVEAAIELPRALRVGAVRDARLTEIVAAGRVGLVAFDGGEALIQPLPPEVTQGARLRVEVTREAIGHKRALCRAASPGAGTRDGPDLAARIRATGYPVRQRSAHDDDALEAAGWSELLEEASGGTIAFTGGALLMSLTPAMTLFDVDGTLAPLALAVAGAAAGGRAIRRLGVAGSIGIDLPTTPGRDARAAAAAALDGALPQPFERTAVNGFGFLQVVRPLVRASLPQMIAADPPGAAARALLRRAERAQGPGIRTIAGHPAAIARLEAEPAWLAELGRRTGNPVALRADARLAMSAGHVDVLPS